MNNQEDLLPVKGLSFQEIYFHPNDFSDELKLKILLLFFKNAKVRIRSEILEATRDTWGEFREKMLILIHFRNRSLLGIHPSHATYNM